MRNQILEEQLGFQKCRVASRGKLDGERRTLASSMRKKLHLKPGNAWDIITVLKTKHQIQVEKEQSTMQVVKLSIFL
jgi:hypothetical protein